MRDGTDGGHDVASLFMHSLAKSWPPLLLCAWNDSSSRQNETDKNIEDNGVSEFLPLENSQLMLSHEC